jgi:hypothetical protein
MPKARTTGCKQQHAGKNCPDCTRIRVRRSRARQRTNPTPRLPLTDAQQLADNAASYVRKYLKRGAIAPPDACDRCAVPVQISPSRPPSRLHFFHPDPAHWQLVAWLCTNCRRDHCSAQPQAAQPAAPDRRHRSRLGRQVALGHGSGVA